jgi:hypothetical protein
MHVQKRAGVAVICSPQTTQSGNVHFMAYIPSWWKNYGDARSPPFTILSSIMYVVYAQAERADTPPPVSTLPLYVLCVAAHNLRVWVSHSQLGNIRFVWVWRKVCHCNITQRWYDLDVSNFYRITRNGITMPRIVFEKVNLTSAPSFRLNFQIFLDPNLANKNRCKVERQTTSHIKDLKLNYKYFEQKKNTIYTYGFKICRFFQTRLRFLRRTGQSSRVDSFYPVIKWCFLNTTKSIAEFHEVPTVVLSGNFQGIVVREFKTKRYLSLGSAKTTCICDN